MFDKNVMHAIRHYSGRTVEFLSQPLPHERHLIVRLSH